MNFQFFEVSGSPNNRFQRIENNKIETNRILSKGCLEVKNGLEILKQLTVDLTSVKTLFQAFDQIDRLMAENGDSFKEIQDFSIQREFANELKENFNDLWVGFTSKL